MKIIKMIGRLGFVITITAFIITDNSVTAIVSFGIACFNIGILFGERGRKC